MNTIDDRIVINPQEWIIHFGPEGILFHGRCIRSAGTNIQSSDEAILDDPIVIDPAESVFILAQRLSLSAKRISSAMIRLQYGHK